MITLSHANRVKDMSEEDRAALAESASNWGRCERLTRDEVVALAQAKDAGSIEARNELVARNMALVIRTACSWTGRGVPLEDLIQEGAIGLMRAADLFDWTRGYEFSTFAGLRIVQACQRAIENQGNAIRIPVHTRSSGLCATDVERAKRIVRGDARDAKERTAFDFVADTNANTEDEALLPIFAAQTAAEIATALLLLNEQERAVVTARYLTSSPQPMRFHAVGVSLGISKQRAEQVQKAAFAKLRSALQGVEN